MKKTQIYFFVLLIVGLALSKDVLASGGYFSERYSLRYSGYEDKVEIKRDDLKNYLGFDTSNGLWAASFHVPTLKNKYDEALALEKQGKYKEALVVFKYIDGTRKDNWEWTESANNPNLIYQEAADRVEVYQSGILKYPTLLVQYLNARHKFVDGDYQAASKDFLELLTKTKDSALIEQFWYMKSVCDVRIKFTKKTTDDLFFCFAKYRNPKVALMLGSILLQNSDKDNDGVERKEDKALSMFEAVMKSFPKSRYADDAAYYTARVFIERKDLENSRIAFRNFAEKYHDDLIAKGKIEDLLSRVEDKFQLPDQISALWELVGPKNTSEWPVRNPELFAFWTPKWFRTAQVYMKKAKHIRGYRGIEMPSVVNSQNDKSYDLQLIPAFYRPYFMLHQALACQNDDPSQCEALLTKALQDYPEHPLTAILTKTLGVFYETQSERHWENRNGNEQGEYSKKAVDIFGRFLTRFPKDPACPQILSYLGWLLPNSKEENSFFRKMIEKVAAMHTLDPDVFVALYRKEHEPSSSPFKFLTQWKIFPVSEPFKDEKLNEMYYVSNRLWSDILKKFPQSLYAKWAYLNQFKSWEHAKDDYYDQRLGKRYQAELKGEIYVPTESPNLEFKKQVQAAYLDPMGHFAEVFLEQKPDDPFADTLRIKQSKLLLDTGSPAKALALVNKYFTRNKNSYWNDEALWVKARSLEETGKEDAAYAEYADLVAKYPHTTKDKINRAVFNWSEEVEVNSNTARSDHGSPYTDYAMGKLALHDEKVGQYEKALRLYCDMGYSVDTAFLVDDFMPISAMEDFIKDYPADPMVPKIKYSIGMRDFREGRFTDAFQVLAGDPKKIEDVEAVSNLIQKISSATSEDEKARTMYRLAKYYYEKNRSVYFNEPVWKDIWEGPFHSWIPTKDKAEFDLFRSYLSLLNRYQLAGQKFKTIIDDFPRSELRDRAMFTYAICQVRSQQYSYSRADMMESYEAISDSFYQVYKDYPDGALADDALFWAGYFTRDTNKKQEIEKLLLQVGNKGDVNLFMDSSKIHDCIFGKGYEHWGGTYQFYEHNQRMYGLDFTTSEAVSLRAEYLPTRSTPESAYDGWLYYKVTGIGDYNGSLNIKLTGLDRSEVVINFEGDAVTLKPDENKETVIKKAHWVAGSTKWINVHIPKPPSQTFSISSFVGAQRGNDLFGSVTTSFSVAPLETAVKSNSVTVVLPLTAKFSRLSMIIANDASLWQFDGTPDLFIISPEGKIARTIPTDQQFQQVIALKDGSLILVPSTYTALTEGKPVAFVLGSRSSNLEPVYPIEPFNRYIQSRLKVENGSLTDGTSIFAKIESNSEEIPITQPIWLKTAFKDAENAALKEVDLTGLKKCGFADDNLDFLGEGLESSGMLSWLGKDSRGYMYFTMNSWHGDAVVVLDNSEKFKTVLHFPDNVYDRKSFITKDDHLKTMSFYGKEKVLSIVDNYIP